MVWLEMNCSFVITDSGGVQKEAYFHSKPCVTLRNETEWTELVDMGVNRLVGVDPVLMIKALSSVWPNLNFRKNKVYGAGESSHLIAAYFNSR
jgi:UDP-GlcNAc3NAcA epimerase